MALVNREIYFYYNSLTSLLANLQAKQRGFTTSAPADPNNESIWGSSKGWLVFKDLDGDLQLLAAQKYYDVTAGAWVRRSNVFANIEADRIYTDTGLKDQYLASDLPISESGETALDAAFSAVSLVGALNELKNDLNVASDFWEAASVDTVIPKSSEGYSKIHTADGLLDAYASLIPLGDASNGGLDASFSATSILGALNELATGGIAAGYFKLAGRSGGQYGYGGTDASDDLTLESTSDSTKGNLILQPNGGSLAYGKAAPFNSWDVEFDEAGGATIQFKNVATATALSMIVACDDTGGYLNAYSSTHPTSYYANRVILGTQNTEDLELRAASSAGANKIYFTVGNASSATALKAYFDDDNFTLFHGGNDTGNRNLIFTKDREGTAGQDNDTIGKIKFDSYNDAATPEKVTYGQITANIFDASDGTEDGSINIIAMSNGTELGTNLRVDGQNDRIYIPGSALFKTTGKIDADDDITTAGDLFVQNDSPEIIIKDTDDTGVAQTGALSFKGSDNLTDAYVGWQDGSSDDFRIQNNKGLVRIGSGSSVELANQPVFKGVTNLAGNDKYLVLDSNENCNYRTAQEMRNEIVKDHFSITIENPTSSDEITIAKVDRAITIYKMFAVVKGGTPSATWTIRHWSARNGTGNQVVTGGTTTTSESTGSEVTSFDDATITADSWIWLEITGYSDITELSISIWFTYD